MLGPWRRVGLTGHRKLTVPQRHWTIEQLRTGANRLRDAGTEVAISGLAAGTDMDWAAAAHGAGLELWAFVPFAEQPDRWPKALRRRWAHLLGLATVAHVVGELDPDLTGQARDRAAVALLHQRNRAVLDAADGLIGVWDGTPRGGTWSCLCDAARRGTPGIFLHAGLMKGRPGLPTAAELRA